jgi:uncharacterized protein DUF2806
MPSREKTRKAQTESNGKRKNPLVSVKDVSLIKVQDLFGLRKAKWLERLISALENKLLGIAPAIIEPVLIRWRANAETYKLEKLSRTLTMVESERAIQLAKARADAMVIEAEGVARVTQVIRESETSDVYVRAINRIRAREVSHQANLEQIIGKAIDLLLEDPSIGNKEAPQTPIDPDWIDRWVEGAQWGSQESVQGVWARILASAARDSEEASSLKLLETLRTVDNEMARCFDFFGPQMYFTRFLGYPSGIDENRKASHKLMNADLFTKLDLGVHNIYLQSCAIRINPQRMVFFTAYRLSALGNELFEVLHPGASEARDIVRFGTRKNMKEVKKFISNRQFESAGRQVIALLSEGVLADIAILSQHHAPDAERFDLEEHESTLSWESMYFKYISAHYRRGARVSIEIDSPNLVEMLNSHITASDKKFLKNLLAKTEEDDQAS